MKVRLNGIDKSRLDQGGFNRMKSYVEKFAKNYTMFKNIFSLKTQQRMYTTLSQDSIIDFMENYRNGTALSHVSTYEDGVNAKTRRSFFKVSLSTEVKDNIVKHELWHLCMRAKEGQIIQVGNNKYVTFHGCQRVTEESKAKIDRGEAKEGDVFGYGSALDEGMANITSFLATIKEKATVYRNGKFIGYNKAILELADKYMETGELDSRLGIMRGYYKIYEDIARLLIMVSRNDYMQEHSFCEVLASNEGIDGWIDDPVNKPYSSFIYSSVNADADFEKEWNNFAKKRKQEGQVSMPYFTLSEVLDVTRDRVIQSGTRGLNNSDVENIKIVIEHIGLFYEEKLDRLQAEGYISKERAEYLRKRYEKTAEGVLADLRSNNKGEPDGR